MKKNFYVILCCLAAVGSDAFGAGLHTNRIEQITGLKGTFNPQEGVFKVSFPRNDVKISVDNWTMPPFMGLTSWASFTQQMAETNLMVMGDIVLFQDEVNPVMSAALDSGLEITALHNHFFFDEPRVYFMHIRGTGSTDELATGVKNIFKRIKEIRAANPKPAATFGGIAPPEKSSISGKPIEDAIGAKGQANNGMFKVVVGRATKMPCGCEAGKDMGVNTWAAFAGSDDNALVDGDFAVLEGELQPVLKTLRHHDINIVAIHSHMTEEQPRILFLHYWGRGKAQSLASALRMALDAEQQ